MKHLSLFSGMGGFDLAAEWMGWNNVAHCEWNPFCQQILKYYWPKAISYADITKTDFSIHRGNIDILTGGFPCQPYSLAGQRKGKDDERHLWPHMLRAIREIKPRWVVGENVLGLVGWNGGLVFEEVQADLEAEGYEVQPYILPAASVNAPHRRDRVWFVAYRDISSEGSSGTCGKTKGDRSKNNDEPGSRGFERKQHFGCGELLQSTSDTSGSRLPFSKKLGRFAEKRYVGTDGLSGSRYVADSDLKLPIPGNDSRKDGWKLAEIRSESFDGSTRWEKFPTQSPICNGNDGISSRLDTITFPKWRNESIKAGGNAIVPQVSLQIFKAIEEYEKRI